MVRLKASATYLLAAAALVWVLHDVHPGSLLEQLVIRHPAWLALAILCDISSYVTQAVRWRLFLLPAGKLSMKQAVQAIYAGLFISEIVPLRFGELGRAYLAARWLSVRFASVLTSLALERLTDGLWLAAAVGAAALFSPLPPYLIAAAKLLGTLIFVSIAIVCVVVWLGRSAQSGILHRVAVAIHSSSGGAAFWIAFASSSLMLILAALSFWFVMKAYALPVAFPAAAVVFLLVRLGTAIPNAPANIGTFQFFVAAGLTFFGVDKTTAAAFSMAVFLILTLPLWLIGFFALSRTGLTLNAIRAGVRNPSMSAVEAR